MAAKCFSAALRRWTSSRNPIFRPLPLSEHIGRSNFSSGSSMSNVDADHSQPHDDLRSRIFRLRFPKRSASDALNRWVQEGGMVTVAELRQLTRELNRAQRYKHALEICEWMISNQTSELKDSDYAIRIDLITKVFGIGAAEEFFEGIPLEAKTAETYTALLHSFAGAKKIEKAESLFHKVKESGLCLTTLFYNELMTLYMSVGQLEKVYLVVDLLKNSNASPDLYTYNLWISASAAVMDVDSVRRVLDEMRHNVNSNSSWMTYMVLTDMYINVNQLANAGNSLIDMEENNSQWHWITYDFLIILHASLGNKDKVGEIWKSLQMTSQKMTKRNYISVLSSYVILGYFNEAGDIIDQWKNSKSSSFNISACRILCETLEKAGLVSVVERFHQLMLQKGLDLESCSISSWMESKQRFQLSALDHAITLELIEKIHGLTEAELYFEKIEDDTKKKTACLALLRCYTKDKKLLSAERFMEKLQNSGYLVNPHPFNEMMKLYASTGQYEKVICVFQKMKEENIPRNVLSYNLLLNAHSEVSDISYLEKVYKEMVNDKEVNVGWSTYATLANILVKFGLHDKAHSALLAAEHTLSVRNRLGYFFLITVYANLLDREGVLRVWESSKRVAGRITCANFMCIILCLVKVDDLGEAERVFSTWEKECRKYDIRVSNVLLGAYVRKGWIEKAETLHLHTMKNGGIPNYKTWEILMEGWVKSKQIDKVVGAMKQAFPLLEGCKWRPPSMITLAIFEYFENQLNLDDAEKYIKILRHLNSMSLPLYKSFLRLHIRAQTSIRDVLKMMEKDKVVPDQEIMTLVEHAVKSSQMTDSGYSLHDLQRVIDDRNEL